MGFFDALGKIVYGAADFAAEAVGHTAKGMERTAVKIDRMNDDEIKKEFAKPVDEVRGKADVLHMQSEMYQTKAEMWKMQKEKREMRAEMAKMEEERLREYNKKCEMSGHNENDEYDDDFGE